MIPELPDLHGTDPASRMRFRVLDGDLNVYADDSRRQQLRRRRPRHHAQLVNALLARGLVAILEVSDPDGIIPPFHIRHEPARN